MNCTETREIIHSYLNDELEEQLLAGVVSHLAGCSGCRRELGNLHTSLDWLRKTYPEQAPPGDLWEKIQGAIETR
ncbi:MAG: zf-HC2 domain-containing protein [Anaerolineales bacterium]|nr:MAG: zf-HC2 domain-containing protein [Anaerolineales bacterium]